MTFLNCCCLHLSLSTLWTLSFFHSFCCLYIFCWYYLSCFVPIWFQCWCQLNHLCRYFVSWHLAWVFNLTTYLPFFLWRKGWPFHHLLDCFLLGHGDHQDSHSFLVYQAGDGPTKLDTRHQPLIQWCWSLWETLFWDIECWQRITCFINDMHYINLRFRPTYVLT